MSSFSAAKPTVAPRRAAHGQGAKKAAFCHFCGRPVEGNGKTVRHKDWPAPLALHLCTDCWRTRPRCRLCGLPMPEVNEEGLCATCLQAHPLCLGCGQPIQGKIYHYEQAGPYCGRCYRSRRRCHVCAGPLTRQTWELPDGRVICAVCQAGAISEPGAAAALYEQVQEVAAQTLGMRLKIPTGVALVDRPQLSAHIRRQMEKDATSGHPSQTGSSLDPQKTLGIYVRRGMRRGIYIQRGLPRMLFLQIVAHEFAHAWQAENYPLWENETVYEGFAEWVAYHVLAHFGYRHAQEQMLARRDLYGHGLRWALDLEARAGPQAVIEALTLA